MIPTIGRTVIVHGIQSNGALDHPAVITRNWGGERSTDGGPIAVNLTAFPDNAAPQVLSSVMLFHTRHDALAHCAGSPGAYAAHWPERAV